MSSDVKFVGWIPGKPWNRRKLRQLGVTGKMTYSPGKSHYGIGVFSHCEATEEVMERLIRDFHLPNPGSFTAIDKNRKDLPPGEQKYWYQRFRSLKIKIDSLLGGQ